VQRFTPLLADAARFARHAAGDRWFVEETYVKVNGMWRYVYRAVDQYDQVIDVLLAVRRDIAAARRFFSRAMWTLKVIPSEVGTDAAPVYPAVLDELVPLVIAPRRTVCVQPDRSRSQPAQAPAPADARTTNRPDCTGGDRRPRLPTELAPWPLRARRRRLPALRIAAAFTELAQAI
jgi:DDE superfamily endonuclease